MKRKFSISILLIIIGLSGFSQQLPHFRSSSVNLLYWNPAYGGNLEAPNILLNHRNQWVGFSGAPKISSLIGKYNFREDMAAGVYLMNDQTGISRKMDFSVNYSYLLKTEMFNISFGLAWTLTQFKILGTEMTLYDVNDQAVNLNADDKTWKPDANAGMVLFSKDFAIGFAINQLFKTKFIFFEDNDVPGTIESHRHFFISGMYNLYSYNKEHRFSPFINAYMTAGTPFKMDIGLKYDGSNNIMSSLAYSSGDAMVFSIGYKYDKFFFEYAFDIVTSRIRNVSSGAHEITLGMFIDNKPTLKEGFKPMF